MNTRQVSRSLASILTMAISAVVVSCSSDEPKQPSPAPPPPKSDLLIFPDTLRAQDESINKFVSYAMKTCSAGEYGPFRLLWSVREEPLPRDIYENRWRDVEEIRVKALEEIRLANVPALITDTTEQPALTKPNTKTPAFVIYTEVYFDKSSEAGSKVPTRQVVLLAVRERGEWRLMAAPAKIRKWIGEKVASTD